MRGVPSNSKSAGINWIKTRDGLVYYTNTGLAGIHRIPIFSNGTASGNAQLVSNHLAVDDFVIDSKGIAYVAGTANVITRVDLATGQPSIVAGLFNSTQSELGGPTAMQFGRSASDHTSLYVTTNSNALAEFNGTRGLSRIDMGDLAQLLDFQ